MNRALLLCKSYGKLGHIDLFLLDDLENDVLVVLEPARQINARCLLLTDEVTNGDRLIERVNLCLVQRLIRKIYDSLRVLKSSL